MSPMQLKYLLAPLSCLFLFCASISKEAHSPSIIPIPPPPANKVVPNIILLTLDGVRPEDVWEGTNTSLSGKPHIEARQLLPNIYHHLVDGGMAMGYLSPMIATGPNHISQPGYLEMMRGHPSQDCQSNHCPR